MSAVPVLIMMSSCPHGVPASAAEALRTSMAGTIEKKGNAYILRYTEHLADDTGALYPRDVTVTMQPGSALMESQGEYGMTMLLEKGRRFEGGYHTPFGDMSLALYTTHLQIQAGLEAGSLSATYHLQTGDEPTALDITLRWRARVSH